MVGFLYNPMYVTFVLGNIMQRKVYRLHQMSKGQGTWVLRTVIGLDRGQQAPQTSLSERTVSSRAGLRVAYPAGKTLPSFYCFLWKKGSSWGSKGAWKRLTADQIWG